MGRPKKSVPAPIEPKDMSRAVPDEEPGAEGQDDGPDTVGRRLVNQSDLVRKAVAAGHEKPATGVPYIKVHFGADIDPKHYSVAKSQLKKREARASFSAEPTRRGPKPKAAATTAKASLVEGYVAPLENPKAAGEPDMLLALEGVKELVSQFGADKVKRMVDLLG